MSPLPPQTKRDYLLKTIDLFIIEFESDEEMKISFNKIKDTICHTAPEILNNRWNDIYLFCRNNLNNINNPSHVSSLQIYNTRLKEFKTLYVD